MHRFDEVIREFTGSAYGHSHVRYMSPKTKQAIRTVQLRMIQEALKLPDNKYYRDILQKVDQLGKIAG